MLPGERRARRRRWVVTVASCAVVSAALPAMAAHASGGSVTGRVTDSAGQPLGAVCVRLALPVVFGQTVATTTTAANGTYQVTAAAGSYHVVFVDCGDRDLVTSYWQGTGVRTSAKAVTVGDGQQVTGVDGTLAAGGSMSGRVTDTSGAGISGVFVDIRLVADTSAAYPQEVTPRTDAGGYYDVHGLPAGSYSLTFLPPDTATYATVLYGDTADMASSPAVEVTAGSARTGVDAHLPRPATISGVVRDGAGEPNPGVCVRATPSLAYDNLVRYAVTGTDGSYTLEQLATGSYRVEFSDCGGVTAATWYPDVTSFGAATPVAVTEGAAVTGIDGVRTTGLHIAGHVRDVNGNPLAHVTVTVHDGNTGSYTGRSVSTNAGGGYSVTGVRGSVYQLKFYGSGEHPDLVDRWWPGVASQSTAGRVSLVAGVSVDGVDVTMPTGGRILGTVTDPTGAPAGGACVTASDPLTGQSGSASTDLSGSYEVRGLDTGAYHLSFRACDPTTNYAPAYYGGTDDPATTAAVSVQVGADTAGIDQRLTIGGTISGTVTDPDGRPIADVCVMPTYGPGLWHAQAGTDASGHYVLTGLAPHDDYRLDFSDCSLQRYVEVWNGGADGHDSAAPIPVTGGDTVVSDVTMERGGSFSGTVRDQFGLPLYGVCVQGLDANGQVRGQRATGQSGTFSIGGLPAGTYTANFSDCGAGIVSATSYATTFDVRAAEDTTGIDVTVTVMTTPAAPVSVGVVPGDGTATVSWQPPADTGHSTLTAFEVRDGSGAVVAQASAGARSVRVTGLANGTTYALTVDAVNVKGAGDPSSTVSVMPRPNARLSMVVPGIVVSGSTASISGVLTDAAVGGVPAAAVDLLGRRHGSTSALTRLASTSTSSTGAYRFSVKPSYPMDYAVRYAGTSALGAATVTKTVQVAPRVTVGASGRAISVTVSPAAGGGRIRLQRWRSGTGWVDVVAITLPSTGRVTVRAPSGGTYRVVVVRTGWATGTSASMRLA